MSTQQKKPDEPRKEPTKIDIIKEDIREIIRKDYDRTDTETHRIDRSDRTTGDSGAEIGDGNGDWGTGDSGAEEE